MITYTVSTHIYYDTKHYYIAIMIAFYCLCKCIYFNSMITTINTMMNMLLRIMALPMMIN